eukprot:jgi/Mesvir1/8664/Mv02606-RA.1
MSNAGSDRQSGSGSSRNGAPSGFQAAPPATSGTFWTSFGRNLGSAEPPQRSGFAPPSSIGPNWPAANTDTFGAAFGNKSISVPSASTQVDRPPSPSLLLSPTSPSLLSLSPPAGAVDRAFSTTSRETRADPGPGWPSPAQTSAGSTLPPTQPSMPSTTGPPLTSNGVPARFGKSPSMPASVRVRDTDLLTGAPLAAAPPPAAVATASQGDPFGPGFPPQPPYQLSQDPFGDSIDSLHSANRASASSSSGAWSRTSSFQSGGGVGQPQSFLSSSSSSSLPQQGTPYVSARSVGGGGEGFDLLGDDFFTPPTSFAPALMSSTVVAMPSASNTVAPQPPRPPPRPPSSSSGGGGGGSVAPPSDVAVRQAQAVMPTSASTPPPYVAIPSGGGDDFQATRGQGGPPGGNAEVPAAIRTSGVSDPNSLGGSLDVSPPPPFTDLRPAPPSHTRSLQLHALAASPVTGMLWAGACRSVWGWHATPETLPTIGGGCGGERGTAANAAQVLFVPGALEREQTALGARGNGGGGDAAASARMGPPGVGVGAATGGGGGRAGDGAARAAVCLALDPGGLGLVWSGHVDGSVRAWWGGEGSIGRDGGAGGRSGGGGGSVGDGGPSRREVLLNWFAHNSAVTAMSVMPGGEWLRDLWTGSELGSIWVWPSESIAEAMQAGSRAQDGGPAGRHAQVMQAGGKELLATRRRDGAISGGSLTGVTLGLQQDPGSVRFLLHVPGTPWVWAGICRQIFLWDVHSLTLQRVMQLDRACPATFVTHHVPSMTALYGAASGSGRRSDADPGSSYASLGQGGGVGADASSRWVVDDTSPVYWRDGDGGGGGGGVSRAGGSLSSAGAKVSTFWNRAKKGVEKFSSDALARVDSSGGGGAGTPGGGASGVRGLFAGIVGVVQATFSGAGNDADGGGGSGRFYAGSGEYGYGYGLNQSPVSSRAGGSGHGGDIGSITCAVVAVDGIVWGGSGGDRWRAGTLRGFSCGFMRPPSPIHRQPQAPTLSAASAVSAATCGRGMHRAGRCLGRPYVGRAGSSQPLLYTLAANQRYRFAIRSIPLASWFLLVHKVVNIPRDGDDGSLHRGDDGSVRVWEAWAPLKPHIGQQVRGALASAAPSYVKPCDFRVFATTWNVCVERPPLSSIATWLRGAASCQLVVVGLQEVETGAGSIVMATAKETVGGIGLLQGNSSGAEWWLDAISSVLREQGSFQRVAARQLAGIVIGVWVHANVMHFVGDISTGAVACGLIGRTLGNKGAVAARLRVNGRSLLLINSHLSAHLENVARRNADYDHICAKLVVRETAGGEPMPVTACPAAPLAASYQDFVVWIGDFNYRIGNLSYEAVRRAIQQKDLEYLVANDQLLLERAANRAFAGMQEAPVTFAPTYKFDKGVPGMAYDSSEKRRVPAWCDRILYQEAKRPTSSSSSITTNSSSSSNLAGAINGASSRDASYHGGGTSRDASSHSGAGAGASVDKSMGRLSVSSQTPAAGRGGSRPGSAGGTLSRTSSGVGVAGGKGAEGAVPAVNVVDGPPIPLEVKVERYDSVPDVCDSDHKAVVAIFRLKLHLVDEPGRRHAFLDGLREALRRWERAAPSLANNSSHDGSTGLETSVGKGQGSSGGRQSLPPNILWGDLLGLGPESFISVQPFASGPDEPSQPTPGGAITGTSVRGGSGGGTDASSSRAQLSASRLFLWPSEPAAELVVSSRDASDSIIFELKGRDCQAGGDASSGGGESKPGSARTSVSNGGRGGSGSAPGGVSRGNPRHTGACGGACPGGGLPSWLRITPLGGVLSPGESKALELSLVTDELSNSRGGNALGALGDDTLELAASVVVHFRREWCEADRWSQEVSVVVASPRGNS